MAYRSLVLLLLISSHLICTTESEKSDSHDPLVHEIDLVELEEEKEPAGDYYPEQAFIDLEKLFDDSTALDELSDDEKAQLMKDLEKINQAFQLAFQLVAQQSAKPTESAEGTQVNSF